MRKVLLALLILLGLCGIANAAVLTDTFGDYNSSGEYRIEAYSDGKIKYASDTYVLYPYSTTSSSGTVTVAATDSGKTYTTSGSNTLFNLPAAVAGEQFTFACTTATQYTVDSNGTDLIYTVVGATPLTAGQGLTNSSAMTGDSITIASTASGYWIVKSKVGTWIAY